MESFLGDKVHLFCGDSREVLKGIASESIDSVVTDPPYALVSIGKRFGKPGSAPAQQGTDGAYARASAGFMGQAWDTGETVFAVEFWAEVARILKPGGHMFAFSGTRTYHRMVCAIEDAGFEIRDQFGWAYGSGFPKSHDVSKAIDKHLGAMREVVGEIVRPNGDMRGGNLIAGVGRADSVEKITRPATPEAAEWEGWGTAVKPAWEPICLARKPLSEKSVAANVLRWGTGAINIDGCRVETTDNLNGGSYSGDDRREHSGEWQASDRANGKGSGFRNGNGTFVQPPGRFPANLIHDGSEEVLAEFPDTAPATVGNRGLDTGIQGGKFAAGERAPWVDKIAGHADSGGSAARFFYTAKADAEDRIGTKHPTVKPLDLMQWLARLVTPPGGTTLDPFAGTGTTGEAAFREGFSAVLIEREPDYQEDIRKRMALAYAGPTKRKRAHKKSRAEKQERKPDTGGLFGTGEE